MSRHVMSCHVMSCQAKSCQVKPNHLVGWVVHAQVGDRAEHSHRPLRTAHVEQPHKPLGDGVAVVEVLGSEGRQRALPSMEVRSRDW